MTTSSTRSAQPPAATPLTVEVWSDVVCPWCYIGKRRLEAALAQVGDEDVQVVWRSFQLDPSAPRPGEPGHGQSVAEHLGQKYGGGREAGLQMSARVSEVAAGDGLAFHLDQAGRGSTVDAHRLLHLAADVEAEGRRGLQDAVKERFLKAYFSDGLDVSDPVALRSLAVQAGLPQDRVEEVLATQEYADDVLADQAQAQAYGATGVPFTVVDSRYGVSGAQPVEVFAEAITRARGDRVPTLVQVSSAEQTTEQTAEAECGPDGCTVPPSH
jgi:predicted DsbA family dithiol-disulfide isomerase